jgi:hypothetical protein
MSQPHTIQIIWHIPVAADIAIYSRGMWHHTVGTSRIYPNTRQHPLHISYFQENAYTEYIYCCVSIYGDKSTYRLMNKEWFPVLHFRTNSITSIVLYELTEASYLKLHHLLHDTVNHWVYFRMSLTTSIIFGLDSSGWQIILQFYSVKLFYLHGSQI